MEEEKVDDKFSVQLLQVALNETESDEDFVIDDESDFEELEAIASDSDQCSDSDDYDFYQNAWDQYRASKERNDSNHFMSKNGSIKWFKNPVDYNGPGTTSADVDCSGSGVQGLARLASTPHDIFSLFFDDAVLDMITTHTNSRLKITRKRYERCRDSKEVTKDELSAFIGLLLYSGIMKSSHSHLKDLWAQDGTGIDIFRLTMSFSRFQFIMGCLRFDDYETRRINMKIDKLTLVRDLMDLIQDNFNKIYTPGSSVSIFEHVVPFRGKCPFKQHSTERPKKHGIKLNCVVDSKTFYFIFGEINTVKRKHDHQLCLNNVLRLANGLRNSYRDVITGVPYTSVPLALALKQRGLFLVGALSRRDKDAPKLFRKIRKPDKSCMYGFTDELTLVSYVPHKKQSQMYLSNRIQDRVVNTDTKPEMICAVDNFEKELEDLNRNLLYFGVGRKTRRWPLLIFFHLLNMTTLNSQVVFNINTGCNSTTKSEFVKQLALGLIRGHMEKRSQSGYLPKELRKRIRLNVDAPTDSEPLITHPVEHRSRGRCHVCSRMRDKKSTTKCCMCHNFVCKEHSLITCSDCYRNMGI